MPEFLWFLVPVAIFGLWFYLRVRGHVVRRPWPVEVVPPYGTVTVPGIPAPVGVPAMADTEDEEATNCRWTVEDARGNQRDLCMAATVDTEFGFWEFTDKDDDLVLIYYPQPGDVLIFEETVNL